MSFVTAIRDYVETLNTISDSLSQNITPVTLLSETSVYVLKTIQSALLYLVSFRWIRDFTLLPIVLPQLSSAIFKESFFLETPSKVFFDFLEIPDLHQNKFLLGFFNSFFFTLPISIVHILSVRRLFIQGIPAGVYSIGGYLTGQILFLTCTVFGLRQILVPWLTLEPLNYIVGVMLIFRIIYLMTQENLTELKGWFLPQYKTFFLTSFLLAWCEQTSVFQYLGNLTISSNVSIIESFSSNSAISSFFAHVLYILGVSLGSIIFTSCWGFLFLQLKNCCILYTRVFLSRFIQIINKTTFIVALALSITSLPFYGFEYLVTGPLGFLSQDSVFKNTLLDQTRIKDIGNVGLLSSQESKYKYIDIDVAPFDRGEYLTAPDVNQSLSFEDLNYRGEFDWIARSEKKSTITDSRSGFFTLSKVFKKQKKAQPESAYQSTLKETMELNSLLSDKRDAIGSSEGESRSELETRFTQWYDVDILDTKSENATLTNVVKDISTASFPTDYLRTESLFQKDIEQKIKEKYYSNPVYKTLLMLDIDLFLKRQPQNFQVSAAQEIDLETKRKMLESYYDSLRVYSTLPYSEQFDGFFDGTKSFSSKVYNQQFKGTLRSVRRLFSLRISDEADTAISGILKFDQPGYTFSDKPSFSPYHEELGNQQKESAYVEKLVNQTKPSSGQNEFSLKNDFFNKPLYAGWDEQVRKFVITNKFLPRKLAGYKVNVQPDVRKNFYQDSRKQGQKIKFTAWPLSSQQVSRTKTESPIPYVTLFQPVDTKTAENLFAEPGDATFSTLPSNVERFLRTRVKKGESQNSEERFQSLAPKRGGFIWPGNASLKLSSS